MRACCIACCSASNCLDGPLRCQGTFTTTPKERSIGVTSSNEPRRFHEGIRMSADGAVFRHAPDNCLPLGRAALRKATLPPSDIDDAKASLERVVDNDIGPRLVLFHHEPIAPCPPEGRPTQADVERLALLVIGQDEAVAVAHFEKVRAQQHAYSTLLSYFIAPAAELLGEYWRQDVCNFFDVTIGVGRLQSFMDRMAAPEPVSTGDVVRRALLIALPGETHLLGIRIVARVLEIDRLGRDRRRTPYGRGQCENGRAGVDRRSRHLHEQCLARRTRGAYSLSRTQRIVEPARRDHGGGERVGPTSGARIPDRSRRRRLRRSDGCGCGVTPSHAASGEAVKTTSQRVFDRPPGHP